MDELPNLRRVLMASVPSSARLTVRHVLQSLGFVVDELADALGQSAAGKAVPCYVLIVAGCGAMDEASALAARGGGGRAIPSCAIGDLDPADDPRRAGNNCTYFTVPIEPATFMAKVRDLVGTTENPTQEPEADPVDLHRLADFAGGDSMLVEELAALYFSTAGSYLAHLQDALDNGADASGPAHALKGASANFGAGNVAALALAVETEGVTLHRLDALRRAVRRAQQFMTSSGTSARISA